MYRRRLFLILNWLLIAGSLFFGFKVLAKEPDWAAEKYSQMETIALEPGATSTVRLGFLNKGRYNWRRTGKNFVSLYSVTSKAKPKNRVSRFFTADWLSPSHPAKLKNPLVAPNRLGYVEFGLRAPEKIGVYKEHFALAAENRAWIPGGEVELTIAVGQPSAAAVTESEPGSADEPSEDFSAGQPEQIISEVPPFGLDSTDLANQSFSDGQEPRFRVGLYITEKPVVFSSPSSYELRDINGTSLGTVEPESQLELTYDLEKKLYQLRWGDEERTSETAVRLAPLEGPAPLTGLEPQQTASSTGAAFFVLHDFANNLRWDKNQNDNKFRDTLEVRWSDKDKFLWVINELPLEDYLKGLIEVPESSPVEFKKAVLTAARTYAYYHLTHPTKHAADGFVVDADYDQVYRGYGAESRAPGNAAAVEATRGLLVTYEDAVVPTPYFANSNGRTRSFQQVWGANLPWLVSVKAPYDRGRRRFGHGVGMSQHDALVRAKKGASFEEILKYYYKGVELKRVYNANEVATLAGG